MYSLSVTFLSLKDIKLDQKNQHGKSRHDGLKHFDIYFLCNVLTFPLVEGIQW